MNYLKNRRGFSNRTWMQRHETNRPSIQGLWNPDWVPPPLTSK